MRNFVSGRSIKIALRRILRHSAMIIVILRWNTGVLALTTFPSLPSPSPSGFTTVGSEGRVGEKGDIENSSGGSRGGRLTTCHTLRAWHAGLIIP